MNEESTEDDTTSDVSEGSTEDDTTSDVSEEITEDDTTSDMNEESTEDTTEEDTTPSQPIVKETTITFNANGGIGSMSAQQVKINEKITLKQNAFTREGYTFQGWSTSENGSVVYADKAEYTMETDVTITLYAVWKANTNTVYTVKHYLENANDNGFTLDDAETLYGITDVTIYPNTKIYTGFNAPSKASVKILPDGSAVLDYYYTRTTHTITFVTNGGDAIETITVKYQQTLALPNALRDGFTFGGWFKDANLTDAFDGNATSNITIYAYWMEEQKPTEFTYSGSNTIEIKAYSGISENLWIPAYIGGKEVTSIAESAFRNHAYLTSIVIPNSVTSIGTGAFDGCIGIKAASMPANAISFIPQSQLALVNITGGVIIDSYAFKNCKSLVDVTIANSIKIIGDEAFRGCSNLAEITIPESVTSFNNGAFRECSSLIRIEIPKSATNIGECAFEDCINLESVVLSKNSRLSNIGAYAFSGCSNLSSINIPNSVTNIGDYAFSRCQKLTTIELPNGLTSISRGMFFSSGIISVTIPSSVTSIGGSAFEYCKLADIYYSGTRAQWNAISKGDYWDYDNYGVSPTVYCVDDK